MSQPIGIQIREALEVGADINASAPPVEQIVALLRDLGLSVKPDPNTEDGVIGLPVSPEQPHTSSFEIAYRVRPIPGGIVWPDGVLSDRVVIAMAMYLLAFFKDHELWMVDGSGSVGFKIEASTLAETLVRKAEGLPVVDLNPPSNT